MFFESKRFLNPQHDREGGFEDSSTGPSNEIRPYVCHIVAGLLDLMFRQTWHPDH